MKCKSRLLKAIPFLILVLILSICSQTVLAQFGVTWTSRTTPENNNWTAITYGNGLFVAVAESGTGNRVMTSSDGVSWTIRTSALDNNWTSVTYGNGLFVAVAEYGSANRVMTSPDGINWTPRLAASGNNWHSVTFGNNLFVAVAWGGDGNRVMTSSDGITWTSRSTPADNAWYSVTFGNGLFVAVSYTGTGNRVMTSSDGINWTLRTPAVDNSWYSVTFGNGLFVAVAGGGPVNNQVMTSPDGTNWTVRTAANSNGWFSVAYGNGLFAAVSYGGSTNKAMTSPDGINWTERVTPGGMNWFGVCYGNGSFAAVAGANSQLGDRVMTSSIPPATGLNFDGVDDNINSGNNASISNLGRDGFTFEAWVSPSNLAGVQSIVRKDGDYNIYLNGGTINAEIWLNGVGNSAWRVINGTATLPLNSWSHVALSWNKSVCTIYINGIASASNASSGSNGSLAPNLIIGRSSIWLQPFTGTMDELRIWNRALCAAEISNNYTGELPIGGKTGLVLSYSFNQGLVGSPNPTITTAIDGSGNGNTGTLTNFALSGATSNWVAGTVTTTAPVFTTFTLAGTTGGPTITYTANVIPAGSSYIADDCGLIARVLPSGGSPVAGSITSKVKIDATVQTYNTSPYVQRHYDIDPATNASTATGTITLYFTQAEFTAYNTVRGSLPALPTGSADATGKANLFITQFHGTGTAPGNYTGSPEFIDPVDANIIWNATNSRWEITFNVTGFSGFYIHTSTGGTLPVSLLSFSGSNKGNYNNLQWTTTAEQNSDRFELERSTDGRVFKTLTSIVASTNSSTTKQYFYDDVLSGSSNPVYFYRLKMVDQNGTFKYSAVVKIKANNNAFVMEVSPNPFANNLQVNIQSVIAEEAQIQLLDVMGKRVLTQKQFLQKGNNAFLLSQVEKLSAGTYFLQVKTLTQIQQIKIIKQ